MANQKRKTKKTKEIENFILKNVSKHPKDIGRIAAQHFGISRQSISGHLNSLVETGMLAVSGMTRARKFELKDYIQEEFEFNVTERLQEDVIWREKIKPLLEGLSTNVNDICFYGLTEMVNNVVDHSGSNYLRIIVNQNAVNVQIIINDTGIGIFKKIQNDFNLQDPRHSLLELSKGKLTSDESKHSGQGIFFTSRMFDNFNIWSERLFYACTIQNEEWLVETENKNTVLDGTWINMEIAKDSTRTLKEVFDRYSSVYDDYAFSKTHIPLELLRYEGEKLLSRSQAKRLLARVDQFKEAMLDFKGIKEIGQAFADEIFRVFKQNHPEIIIVPINTTPEIDKMIFRAASKDEDKQKSLLNFQA